MTTMEENIICWYQWNKPFLYAVLSHILAREKYRFCMASDKKHRIGFYMNQQLVWVISLDLANTNIQYKQISYDADNTDNNK